MKHGTKASIDQRNPPVPGKLHGLLRDTFSTTGKQHLRRCVLGLPLAILFHHNTSSLPASIRFFTAITATCYYPLLCLTTSILLSPLLFLRRQTNALNALLTTLLDTLISPLRHIKSPTKCNVSEAMAHTSKQVLKTEAVGCRRTVIWVLLTVIKKVLEVRFGEIFSHGGLTAERLGTVVGKELIGLVLGPVQSSLLMAILSVAFGAALFGAAPFVLLRVLTGYLRVALPSDMFLACLACVAYLLMNHEDLQGLKARA